MTQSSHYVIAISSVAGGGKTTLVKRTTELLCGTALFFDDYDSVSNYPDEKRWLKDGADMNEWKTPQFAKDLSALRSGNSIVSPINGNTILPSEFIIIEEPTGRERIEMASLIDFVVVINTPLEIALARVLLREAGMFFPENLENETKEKLAECSIQPIKYLKIFLGDYLDSARLYFRTFFKMPMNKGIRAFQK